VYVSDIYNRSDWCWKNDSAKNLNDLGYEAHDADEDICSWFNNATGEKVLYPKNSNERPADFEKEHTSLMDERLIEQLYNRSSSSTIFILGTAKNEFEIAKKYFKKVLCLHIDKETIVQRVLTRKTNAYGKDPDQMATILKWYAPTINRYKKHEVTMIDATRLPEIVFRHVLEESA
jgi:hypothetical protein